MTRIRYIVSFMLLNVIANIYVYSSLLLTYRNYFTDEVYYADYIYNLTDSAVITGVCNTISYIVFKSTLDLFTQPTVECGWITLDERFDQLSNLSSFEKWRPGVEALVE